MNKFMMALVCLMTMVVFTSCSTDDEEIYTKNDIVGSWILMDIEGYQPYTLFSFGKNGKCLINDMECKYYVSDNSIHIQIKGKYRNGSDAEIAEAEAALKNARGGNEHYWRDKLYELKKYATFQENWWGTIIEINRKGMIVDFSISTYEGEIFRCNFIKAEC